MGVGGGGTASGPHTLSTCTRFCQVFFFGKIYHVFPEILEQKFYLPYLLVR